jgi:hypothetical protein
MEMIWTRKYAINTCHSLSEVQHCVQNRSISNLQYWAEKVSCKWIFIVCYHWSKNLKQKKNPHIIGGWYF